jgi:hypothetical protein
LFETIFSDGLACRLPVFLTKGGVIPEQELGMLYFTEEEKVER